MAEKDKKYYWLRLKRDFFKRHDIQIIEDMQNGKEYILFYLKLLCESVDHEGNLRFSNEIPYNEQMLSTITRTNIDIVRSAVQIFSQLGMIEILDDGTYYMQQVKEMIGSETYWAQKKREQKKKYLEDKKNDVGNFPTEVQQKSNSFPTSPSKSIEIEIDKDIDKDKEIERREKINYQQIADMYNETCVSFHAVRSLSDSRKKAIKARLHTYSIDDFKTLFEKAEASDFLKGKNGRNWSASFDWLLKDANMVKVLEGNYDNKEQKVSGQADAGYDLDHILKKDVPDIPDGGPDYF